MSPEQARGDNIDHRTDLFSLGTVLYTLLSGHSPFRAENPMAVLRRVCDDTPRPLRECNPSVPDWLEAIIARLHAKDPADRFESASQVADILKRCLAHVQQPTRVPLPAEVTQLLRRSGRVAVGPRTLIAATTLGLALFGAWQLHLNAQRESQKTSPSTESAITESQQQSTSWDDRHPQEAADIDQAVKRLETESESQF
jgi:serine/threonine-protein kinase